MKLDSLKSSLLAGFTAISFLSLSTCLNPIVKADTATGTLQYTATNELINAGGKCLQADAKTLNVSGWFCNKTQNQSWVYTQGHLVSASTNLCLSIDPATIGINGAGIGLAPCNTSPAQGWTYNSNSTFINSGGKCLQIVPSQLGINGAQVQGWSCNGQPQQAWTFTNY